MSPRRLRPSLARSAFAGFCFPPEVIVLAVRWSRFALSYRDVVEAARRGDCFTQQCLPEVLELMSAGSLRPETVTTTVASIKARRRLSGLPEVLSVILG
jgi:hypothetical protein